MAKEIRMPDLGTVESEVALRRWLKAEGEHVARGEPICEVESDKAVSDLESAAEGILLRKVVAEGSVVRAGEVIGYIGKEGETAGESEDPRAVRTPVMASPMIVALAKRMGVDLHGIRGSGPGGQITRADLAKAGESGLRPADPADAAQPSPAANNQLSVARIVAASWREVVPICLWGSVRMDRAVGIRGRQAQGNGPSYDSMFVFALARAVRETPSFRCRYVDGVLVSAEAVHISLAVSNERGLFLPVIRHADEKSLAEIDAEVRNLADKAASGGLAAEDLGGAAVTVSNLGMLPVDSFTAIIPPRQSAILTIGRIRDAVTFREGCIGAEKQAQVILTVDHRFINGREAALLLARVVEEMENL